MSWRLRRRGQEFKANRPQQPYKLSMIGKKKKIEIMWQWMIVKCIMGLAELKQECLARGLETKGIKQDLIHRLQAYLEEHAEEEANEEDVLGDETEEEETKPIELPVKEEEPPEKTVDVAAEKKVVKITSEIPQTERMQKRAERFNVPVSLESKKAARAARFGISSVPTKGESQRRSPTGHQRNATLVVRTAVLPAPQYGGSWCRVNGTGSPLGRCLELLEGRIAYSAD
ncbi:hypothetical protein P7K49_019703 [Saguinus oedipus]|uniref:SAP domain-containing protein n=1 Tax=Saguinus oedipus TaxID=9490 RepID=A0ABQ9UYU1_SAGOE|nr:hypothetical protein P7K49_019703 [Saguinus oedipus]